MKKKLKSTSHKNSIWLDSFLSYSNESFIVVDHHFNILFANPKSKTFINRKITELIGSSIHESGVFGSLISKDLSQVIKKQKAATFEYSYQYKNVECIEVSYTPIPDKDYIQVILITRDITDHKKFMDDLKIANKRMELQSKALQHYDIISESDLFGNISYASQSFLKISGYTIEDILHKNYRMFNSNHHKADFFEKLWKTVIRGDVWSGFIKNSFKDGRIAWLDTIISPIYDDQGNMSKFLSMQRDINDTQLKLEEGQDFLSRFKEACMQSPIILISLDLSGNIVFTNNHFLNLVNYKQEFLHDKNFIHLFTENQQKNEIQRTLLKVISKKNKPIEFTSDILTSKNETKVVQWKASATLDTDGSINGMTLIGENITDKNKNKDKLTFLEKKLEENQEKTFGFLTHQLKAGLNSIKAGLDLLSESQLIKNDQSLNNITEKIQEQIVKTKQLNSRFLDTLQNSNQSISIKKQKFDIYPVIKEVLRENISKSKTTATQKILFNANEYILNADPFVFKEIINNLVHNALKYAKDKNTHIEIEAQQLKHFLVISISDQGIGMTPKEAKNSFKIFQRANTEKKGHGIGLKFCFDMMQKHRGRIWLESQKNQGTTLFLSFPQKSS